jgi:hypothetical protein
MNFLPKEIETIINDYKFELEYDIRVHNHKFHNHFIRTINQINDMYTFQFRTSKYIYPNKNQYSRYHNPNEIVRVLTNGNVDYISVDDFYDRNTRIKRGILRRPAFFDRS